MKKIRYIIDDIYYSLQGFVVVETNFRMYSYTSSKLHCEILRLFSRYVSALFDSLLCICYSFFLCLGATVIVEALLVDNNVEESMSVSLELYFSPFTHGATVQTL